MARLIDADVLIKKIKKEGLLGDGYSYDERESDVIQMIEECDTVDAEPVKHGRWIEIIEDGKMKRVTSCCGDDQTKLTVWYKPDCCPHCGAKMDEETKHE